MKMFRLPAAVVCIFALFASPAPAEDTIKIGAILSVSGGAANLGKPEMWTLHMLTQELNAKGGVAGKKVELIIRDSGGDPQKAASLAKQLINEEKVFAIIGPSTSGETMRIKDIAEKEKTILISCAAAEVIVNPVARWVFKTPQMDKHAIIRIFEQMKQMGISKIGVLSSDTGFGKAGRSQIQKLAPIHGITILEDVVYDGKTTDLTAEITKISAAKVQGIINWSIEPAQSVCLRNARRICPQTPVFQSHGFGNINYVKGAGAAADGVIFPSGRLVIADTLPDKHPQKTVLMAFKKNYESLKKDDVSTFGGHAYDALMILAKAIEKAGPDREKVRDAIENMKGFVGTAGVFNFSPTDHNGLDLDSFEMLTVKNGKFVSYGK